MTDVTARRITDHRETVREFSQKGGPLDPNGPNATTANRQWFFESSVASYTPERGRLHERLLAEAWTERPGVRADRRAIVLAGPPGAGKSTIREKVLGPQEDRWLFVDADEFKRKLLAEAVRDGSYEAHLKPPAIKEREAAGEAFYPLELAALVHEESSYLATRLRDEALSTGTNVVLDAVLSNSDKAVALGRILERAKYRVEVIDVEVPYEVSELQITQRWREAYEGALTSGDGLGGRWVPSDFTRSVFDSETGRSLSQDAAQKLAQSCASVERYRRYWRPSNDAQAVVEVDQTRRVPGGVLVDTALVATVSRGQARRAETRRNLGDLSKGTGR